MHLVFSQEMPNDQAYIAEHQIKQWSRAKKEASIAQDWNLLTYLVRNQRSGSEAHCPCLTKLGRKQDYDTGRFLQGHRPFDTSGKKRRTTQDAGLVGL